MECSEYRNLRDSVPTRQVVAHDNVSSCANIDSYTLKRNVYLAVSTSGARTDHSSDQHLQRS